MLSSIFTVLIIQNIVTILLLYRKYRTYSKSTFIEYLLSIKIGTKWLNSLAIIPALIIILVVSILGMVMSFLNNIILIIMIYVMGVILTYYLVRMIVLFISAFKVYRFRTRLKLGVGGIISLFGILMLVYAYSWKINI